ncbi:agamous-like MADS-box protein AGL80 [Cicer arietinum]|uniref:Agamous-like MADS-box protein AGL80 n=1 Tax=Cicer arietinum TaxID=3827 RepID=A0A1S2XKK0_CICAR|nr:agamous-like MADS-box protein AGL80 [Cicer arietinum]
MGGRKVKLAFIAKDTARKAAYKKRIKGFMKKLNELTTLCGVRACAIVFKPDEREPQIWPSFQGVQNVLIRFMHIPDFERDRKMMNQETYLKERVLKVKEKLKKKTKDNRKTEMTVHMYNILETGIFPENFNTVDQNDLTYVIDEKIKEIQMKMVELDNVQAAVQRL